MIKNYALEDTPTLICRMVSRGHRVSVDTGKEQIRISGHAPYPLKEGRAKMIEILEEGDEEEEITRQKREMDDEIAMLSHIE